MARDMDTDVPGKPERFSGMSLNERLIGDGLLDAFDAAAKARNFERDVHNPPASRTESR